MRGKKNILPRNILGKNILHCTFTGKNICLVPLGGKKILAQSESSNPPPQKSNGPPLNNLF
jgi:hypothetical protein